LILPRIRETKKNAAEETIKGRSWHDLAKAQLPPCLGERANFMSPADFVPQIRHPYSDGSPAHAHFAPTPFRHPPYSAACIPFAWMLKEPALEKVRAG
jgi:hypothetical protein